MRNFLVEMQSSKMRGDLGKIFQSWALSNIQLIELLNGFNPRSFLQHERSRSSTTLKTSLEQLTAL